MPPAATCRQRWPNWGHIPAPPHDAGPAADSLYVDPPATSVSLCLSWNAGQERMTALRPAKSHAVFLDWQSLRWPAGHGIRAEIAQAAGPMLSELGPILGCDDMLHQAGPRTRLLEQQGHTDRLRPALLCWQSDLDLTGRRHRQPAGECPHE